MKVTIRSETGHLIPFRCSRRLSASRCFSTRNISSRNNVVTDVAVLGGGITGLAAAHYLNQAFPKAKIVIFEASPRLGGWIRSAKVATNSGEVVFEHGPRTLRPAGPAGLVTIDLIRQLNLEDDLLLTSRDSAAAHNRYIYYPNRLVRMPGPHDSITRILSTFLSEPIFRGGRASFFTEPFKPRGSLGQDESVSSFISRRFSSHIADNVVSAILHGIYAGDSEKLSSRALLPWLKLVEDRYGSLLNGLVQMSIRKQILKPEGDIQLEDDLFERLEGASGKAKIAPVLRSSVYTFRGGLETLVNGLKTQLGSFGNVEIKTDTKVTAISMPTNPIQSWTGTKKVKVEFTPNVQADVQTASREFSHVISTVSARSLAEISGRKVCTSLANVASVTVMVVNLFFNNPNLLPVPGFGYLLPRSVSAEQNPEKALGVVFDSESSCGQDTAQGTKLTVMLGGHWWDGLTSYPSKDEGVDMARGILARHLKIREKPAIVNATLQTNCIPQYVVGHMDRLEKGHEELLKQFEGSLVVCGSGFRGVGVNDCIRSALDIVKSLQAGDLVTGLERKEWSWCQRIRRSN